MMKTSVFRIGFACWIWAVSALGAEVQMGEHQRVFFQKYCLDCHNEEKQKGKVRLDDLPLKVGDVVTAERWQKVLNALNSGEMPPEEEKQPQGPEKAAFLESLSESMVVVRRMLSDSGGVITMRRLNKREYQNTMEELLGVAVNAKDLPNDGGGMTFDTIGKSLFFSSDQFEQYVSIGRQAIESALGGATQPTRKVRVEVEEEANARITHILRNYQMKGFRAYKQWKASNGKPPSDFGIVDEGEMKFRLSVWERNTPPMIDYLTRPESRSGAFLTVGEPNPQVGLAIPDEMPPGTYRIRARMGLTPEATPSRSFLEIGVRGKSLNDAISLIACRKISAPLSEGEVIEAEVVLPKLTVPLKEDIGPETKKVILLGERVIGFRERQHNTPQVSSGMYAKAIDETGFGIQPALWVDWVEWEGPIRSQRQMELAKELFFKGPDAIRDEAYAREILERFARRAFRGKEVRSTYLDKLVGHFRDRQNQGESFEQALMEPLSIVLASPSFLYLSEPSSGKDRRRPVDGRELADRLSYFLWSAPPDEELSRLASSGELGKKEVLAAQVERLLASPRSWEFVSGFGYQWLHLERLGFFQFNYRLFPEFDESVRQAAKEEVFHTLQTILAEGLPLGALLKSDFVVINDLLAHYYGIPGVHGSHFRKVQVPEGLPRGGFLGMAAILAMGSDGERSSPVERGAWVLRTLLHKPPPPAPANVPQLSRHAGKLLSARDLLAAHMEEAQCAQCHRKIDPIGFGLEHFNAAGLWREKELTEIAAGNRVKKAQEHEIDASGSLPDGTAFRNFFEMRDGVAARQDAFAKGVIEPLISYALGRPFGFSDAELAEEIYEKAKAKNFSLRAIVHALVESKDFHTK